MPHPNSSGFQRSGAACDGTGAGRNGATGARGRSPPPPSVEGRLTVNFRRIFDAVYKPSQPLVLMPPDAAVPAQEPGIKLCPYSTGLLTSSRISCSPTT